MFVWKIVVLTEILYGRLSWYWLQFYTVGYRGLKKYGQKVRFLKKLSPLSTLKSLDFQFNLIYLLRTTVSTLPFSHNIFPTVQKTIKSVTIKKYDRNSLAANLMRERNHELIKYYRRAHIVLNLRVSFSITFIRARITITQTTNKII